eukprot:618846-Pleurochrysis_carterae.AAC.3
MEVAFCLKPSATCACVLSSSVVGGACVAVRLDAMVQPCPAWPDHGANLRNRTSRLFRLRVFCLYLHGSRISGHTGEMSEVAISARYFPDQNLYRVLLGH